jgi:methyl-accepting chemotaxis protein
MGIGFKIFCTNFINASSQYNIVYGSIESIQCQISKIGSDDVDDFSDDIDDFSDDIDDFSDDIDDSSDDIDDFSDYIDDFSDNINDFSDNIDDFSDNFDDFSDNIDDFSDNIDDFSDNSAAQARHEKTGMFCAGDEFELQHDEPGEYQTPAAIC